MSHALAALLPASAATFPTCTPPHGLYPRLLQAPSSLSQPTLAVYGQLFYFRHFVSSLVRRDLPFCTRGTLCLVCRVLLLCLHLFFHVLTNKGHSRHATLSQCKCNPRPRHPRKSKSATGTDTKKKRKKKRPPPRLKS